MAFNQAILSIEDRSNVANCIVYVSFAEVLLYSVRRGRVITVAVWFGLYSAPGKFIAWDLPSQRKALPLRSFYGSKGWPYGQHGYSFDPVAQLVEHIPFKDGALGSSPSWITSQFSANRREPVGIFCEFACCHHLNYVS